MMSATPQPSSFRFETTDAFEWSGLAAKWEAFLLTETEFVDDSLVASLNPPFRRGDHIPSDVEESFGLPS